jgi:hypothetical protein
MISFPFSFLILKEWGGNAMSIIKQKYLLNLQNPEVAAEEENETNYV